MYCTKCNEGEVFGTLVLNLEVMLKKGGGINLNGVRITHNLLKTIWEKSHKMCICDTCGTNYRYIPKKGLKYIPFGEAKKKKYGKPFLLHFP